LLSPAESHPGIKHTERPGRTNMIGFEVNEAPACHHRSMIREL
jgi:hypothetical protein